MKVRIGYGLGVRTKLHDATFGLVVDELERLRFDSLWLSERIGGEAPDPLVAMSFAAGRTETLKFGMSVMVLPGRNPIVLAKELATLAVMSGGRLLPAFGLGVADPHEQQAFGVERGERAKLFDESLAVMRACWTGEPVVHHGDRFHYDGVRVLPAPGRLDVWLGGYAPSELRRVGRLADGWLPSFITPADAAEGRTTIEQVCAEHDRSIDDDHYGVLIPYSFEPDPRPGARPLPRPPSRSRRPVGARARVVGAVGVADPRVRRRRLHQVRRDPARRAGGRRRVGRSPRRGRRGIAAARAITTIGSRCSAIDLSPVTGDRRSPGTARRRPASNSHETSADRVHRPRRAGHGRLQLRRSGPDDPVHRFAADTVDARDRDRYD